MPSSPRVVVLHGWENRRPPGHWEHLLVDRLRERGIEAEYPQLPDPDTPSLEEWLGVLSSLVDRGDRPVTLVAHSLATSLWLSRLARGAGNGDVTRLALVAIPSPAVLASTVVSAFVDHPPSVDLVPGVEMHVFEGEGDEYAPGGLRASYLVDPAIPVELVPRGGHLVPETGFGEWPRILEWVVAPAGDGMRGG
jgi:uncharacterized protein